MKSDGNLLLLLLAVVFAGVSAAIRPECEEDGRSSRCLLSCVGAGGRVRGRRCPLGWVCCRDQKANPFLPIRPGQGGARQPRKSRPSLKDYLDTLKKKYRLKPGVKSARYCKEWTKLSMEFLHAMPLLPEVIPLRIKVDNCAPNFTPLIVGGKNATEGEFPHMAALGYFRNDGIDYLCGGTLVSEKFVLTAAHCANTRWGPPVVVQLGSKDLYSADAVELEVVDITVHPKYSPPSCYHDLALLKLEDGLKLSFSLRPACLPSPETKAQFPGSVAVATGWGKTGIGREATPNLKKVALKVIDNKKCEKYYTSDINTPSLNDGITSDLLCAGGFLESFHDTCQGDSGGPLQAPLPGSDCTFQVVGITSFGKACGAAMPAVYTRVAPYIAWIENIIWP